jgi:hypothetical protein
LKVSLKYSIFSGFIGIIIIFLQSCIEPYDPGISTKSDIIVFDGSVTNDTAPSYVYIQHSIPYGSSGNAVNESGALVEIRDDLGNAFSLNEVQPGRYASNYNGFQAKTGRSYSLHVITKAGKEYRTDPVLMQDVSDIDSLYVLPKISESLKTNLEGQNSLYTDAGYELYSNVKGNSANGSYYKFDASMTLQYTVIYDLGLSKVFSYCWLNKPLTYPFVITETHTLQNDAFNGLPINFYSGTLPTEELITNLVKDPKSMRISSQGWISRVRIYSISQDYYAYLNRLSNQIDAQDKLFDPAIDKVAGNVYNVTDRTETTLGYFSVSAVKRKSIYLYLGTSLLECKILPFTPPLVPDGYTIDSPPLNWIKP